jgi:GT2 family glycosyltransferase
MGIPELPAACGQRIAELNLRLEWLPWQQHAPHPVPTLGGGFMAMRRELLDDTGGFDEGMAQWGSEDVELCIRYWLLGYEVWVVPDVTVLHYFRATNPLKLRPGIVTHNVLRVALLHFNKARIARVTAELQKGADFGQALAHAVESDVWQQRAALAGRRVRNDDWLFEQFKESCPL